MTAGKRTFDLLFSVLLGALLFPLVCVLILIILITQGRPVFYISERMKTPNISFCLIKLRTMRPVPTTLNEGVSGGDKSDRISTLGRFLRKTRLDELPQIINIIKGDMSFVGPRPPLRQYVEDCPEIYTEVLICRPGITGLATLVFHAHEEHLLAACMSANETEQIYRRRCIPRKARLDMIYARNKCMRLDVWLLAKTFAKIFSLHKKHRS